MNKKTILFEIDKNITLHNLLNYESGIWFWTITPINITFKDDYGKTCYYDYDNKIIYMIKSVYIDGEAYPAVESIADLRTVEESFYYDSNSSKIYFHFNNFDPPLNKSIKIGVVVGYSYNADTYYFQDRYYDPRVEKLFPLKKSIDREFYGKLQYQSGRVNFKNKDSYFDKWNDEENYGNAARFLIGNGYDYNDYELKYSGYIDDFSLSWSDFSVSIQDVRKSLTQPVCTNDYILYTHIKDENKTKRKPVAYGLIRNAKCICTNENEYPVTNYTFLMCDTEYNPVSALIKVYVDSVEKTPVSTNLTDGTFTLSVSDVGSNISSVTANFTASTFANGVDILKDLMYRYDNKNYITSFWDILEVDSAQALSRTTSLYISDNMKLSECIESVCNDCDLRFFTHDDGKYTIRLYDKNRVSNRTILYDEWIGEPTLKNDANQFLTSAIIKYSPNIDSGDYLTYTNKDYEVEAFSKYRAYKEKEFETSIDTEANAILKSETIMKSSSNIKSIINRNISLDIDDIEITDFITCDPWSRDGLTEVLKVYEVLSLENDYSNNSMKLSLQYVRD